MRFDEETPLEIASRRRRFFALLIDWYFFQLAAILIIVNSLLPYLTEETVYDEDQATQNVLHAMIFGGILYLCRDVIMGISPGKWIMGVKVVTNEGHYTPNFFRLVGRNISLLILFPFEFLVVLVNPEKRRLGDLIVGTKVVEDPRRIGSLFRFLSFLMITFGAWLMIYMYAMNWIKSTDDYQAAAQYIQEDQQVQEVSGGIVDFGYHVHYERDFHEDAMGAKGSIIGIKVIGQDSTFWTVAALRKSSEEYWELDSLFLEE